MSCLGMFWDDDKYAGETLRSILKTEKAKKTETPQARRSSEWGILWWLRAGSNR